MRSASFARVTVLVCATLAFSACDGCTERVTSDDAGNGAAEGEGDVVTDAGVVDAGKAGEGEGEGEGEVDAGEVRDGGNGFDLGSLLDGGVDGLQCLPTSLPDLSISGALDALGLGLYTTGHHENGVRCGVDPRVTCGPDTPCCVLCGLAGCAAPVDGGSGPPECPAFSQTYACDGDEDCDGQDICCFTLSGTECRAPADCAFDVNATLGQFLNDGGIAFPDAGGPVDGGFFDGGFVPEAVDGGDPAVDGGFKDVPVEGLPGPQPDAGTLLDGLQTTLDQGVPVCTSAFFDCDVLHGEACCTSDRLPAVDVGFCLPVLLCAGSLLP